MYAWVPRDTIGISATTYCMLHSMQHIVAQLLLTRNWDIDPVITYTDTCRHTLLQQ